MANESVVIPMQLFLGVLEQSTSDIHENFD